MVEGAIGKRQALGIALHGGEIDWAARLRCRAARVARASIAS